jgi:acetyl esterase/lipase/putative cell wall-binding protein
VIPSSCRLRRAVALVCGATIAASVLPGSAGAAAVPSRIPAPVRAGDSTDVAAAAIDLSQHSWGDGAATVVVLGRDDVFADALAGAALAGTDGPVLFTTHGSTAGLRDDVRAEIARVLAADGCVTVLGGTSAVSPAVVDELQSLSDCVRRIGGTDRIDTALLVARESDDPSEVLLARADTWPDAAAASVYAATTGHPIILTPSEDLAPPVEDYLSDVDASQITLLGGTAALSTEVESAAADHGPTRRVQGTTRDATAIAIANTLVAPSGAVGVQLVPGWASTGWAYAIAGAVTAALDGSVELFVQPTELTSPDGEYLDATTDTFTVATGPGSLVTDGVVTAVEVRRGWHLIDPPGASSLRYRDQIFDAVTTTSDVTYGTAVNRAGTTVTLRLDVYEPADDDVMSRPAIVWVHGGGFSSGNKTSPEIVDEARSFARAGFVNVSIDYRLEPEGCSAAVPTVACIDAIREAMEDAQTAVRFLRTNAATYGIDPTRIGIGGSSAGAITAVNVAYESSEDPSSAVGAALSLSGANILGHQSAGDAPVLLFHGTNDGLVPYEWAASTLENGRVAGNLTLLTTWPGEGHVPYVEHRDEVLEQSTDFLWWTLDLAGAAT